MATSTSSFTRVIRLAALTLKAVAADPVNKTPLKGSFYDFTAIVDCAANLNVIEDIGDVKRVSHVVRGSHAATLHPNFMPKLESGAFEIHRPYPAILVNRTVGAGAKWLRARLPCGGLCMRVERDKTSENLPPFIVELSPSTGKVSMGYHRPLQDWLYGIENILRQEWEDARAVEKKLGLIMQTDVAAAKIVGWSGYPTDTTPEDLLIATAVYFAKFDFYSA
jgi:hypothetical protein